MSKKYVKKPIPVSALQWTGENFEEIKAFCTDENGKTMCITNHKDLWIRTREGELKASVRDYIMRGIEGEFYPCAESIFLKSYDELSDIFGYGKMPVKSLQNMVQMEWNEELLIKFALFHANRMRGANQTDSEFYAKQSLQIFIDLN
jgi:hypothetical protein